MNLNKLNIVLAWVIFLSMLIVSCTVNKRYDQLLAKADSFDFDRLTSWRSAAVGTV